jgi:hypothetical protein
LALVAIVIAIQLVVPALALRHDRPAAFGWQMFASDGAPPVAEVVRTDGTTSELPWRDVVAAFAAYRPEIAAHEALARHLCERHPSAQAVVLRDPSTRRVEERRRC